MSGDVSKSVSGVVDLAALAWLRLCMDQHLDEAESRLVNASREGSSPAELLRCLWAIHHVTAGLRSIGLQHATLLGLELERSLHQLLLEEVNSERRNLILGGIMRGLQILPACLDLVEETGGDSGHGLAPCVNDLRRWRGEIPRPEAQFFHCYLSPECGISSNTITDDKELRKSAGLLLAPWVQSARSLLTGRDSRSAARTLGRIAHKLQQLFRGQVQERFWLGVIGLSEGLAAGMFQPDEVMARILKVGALLIKQAREHGPLPLVNLDTDRYLQQILFYLAACPVRTLYMQHVCEVCRVDEHTVAEFNRPPVHRDALCTVLRDADRLLQSLIDELESGDGARDSVSLQASLQALEQRLQALGEAEHLQGLEKLRASLGQDGAPYRGLAASVANDLLDLQLAIRQRLHWRGRRLVNAQAIESQQRLLACCRTRLLTVMQQLDEHTGDIEFTSREVQETGQSGEDPDSLLADIIAVLGLIGREREAGILVLARNGLSRPGPAPEAQDLSRFAFAFACLEVYWEQYLADPRAADERRIDAALESLSHLPDTVDPGAPDSDAVEIPELLHTVFAEECAEQLEHLQSLLPLWESTAARDESLREMRRHFHTLKGNGHAVGARRLAELGREAQEMLDRVLESTEPVDPGVAPLLCDLIAVLPGLLTGNDTLTARHLPELVQRCRTVQRGGY